MSKLRFMRLMAAMALLVPASPSGADEPPPGDPVVRGTAFFQGDAGGIPFFLAPGDGPRPLLLVVARRKAEAHGVEAATSAARAMERGLGAVAADPESNAIFEGQTHLFWSSFRRACPAEDLGASDSDLFLAYGTADEEVDAGGVEAITAARIAARKPVRVERIIGGSHGLNTPDTEPFENLVGVLAAAIHWMASASRVVADGPAAK